MGFVFAADTHLCNRNIKKQRTMTGDSLHSFRQILQYAAAKDSSVVLGGDVFDSPRPDPQAVVDYVGLTEEYQVEIFFVTGQHDSRDRPWALTSRWANHMHPDRLYSLGGVGVRGLNWAPEGIAGRIRKAVPPSGTAERGAVFVGHQVWKEFNYGVAEASFAEIPANYDLALVGDYHIYQDRSTVRPEAPPIRTICPGSISMMSIDEPCDKQFLWVDKDLTVSTIPLKTRPVIREHVGTSHTPAEDDLHRIVNIIKDMEGKKTGLPMLHVSYNPETPDVIKRIRIAVGTSAYLWLKDAATEETQEEGKAPDAILSKDVIEQAIANQLKGEELAIALQLWQSTDMKRELETIGEAYL